MRSRPVRRRRPGSRAIGAVRRNWMRVAFAATIVAAAATARDFVSDPLAPTAFVGLIVAAAVVVTGGARAIVTTRRRRAVARRWPTASVSGPRKVPIAVLVRPAVPGRR